MTVGRQLTSRAPLISCCELSLVVHHCSPSLRTFRDAEPALKLCVLPSTRSLSSYPTDMLYAPCLCDGKGR